MARFRAATVVVVALAAAGCTDDAGRSPEVREDATPSASRSTAESGATGGGATGSPRSPASLEATPDLLDWREVPGPTTTAATVSGRWRLSVPERATTAVLDGPRPTTVEAPARHRITDALIDGEYAVVVSEDTQARQGNVATVIDLASGNRFTVDDESEVPTTTGGTWSLGEGQLLHATTGPERSYCLATVDLARRSSSLGWCAPARHGFNGARITPAGTALLTFDDHRPSCRTLVEVVRARVTPLPGAPQCTGWDAALVPDGAVWSVAAKAQRIEEARFFARARDDWFSLGPGMSGSLTWCAGATYFVRDPQQAGEPARLMRWSPDDGLTVAFETAGRGPAFLSEPRCGGDTLTVTALAESGDRQVTAPAP